MCTACSINGTFQGLYSYYNITKSESSNLLIKLPKSISICKIKNNESVKVYLVNGKELKECINNLENALVYIWSPKCTGRFCYSIELIQKNDIDLFIVSEYYDSRAMQKFYKIDKPLFGIDTEFYKSNLTSIYLKKFIEDLTNQEIPKVNFYKFKSGNLIKSFNSIDDVFN